ncbi:MAG TPA: NAD(P)-dependent oxidoreductase [Jatrophihabitans sp.]|nr:NAD(P)-dependent oxidoreductase [Jatrophihabitans sp.]
MTPLVFIGGEASPAMETAVRAGGGQVTTDPASATAVVWLSKQVDDLRAVLHDDVRWVQLPDAGIERWLDAGLIDTTRTFTSARGCYGRAVAEHALALVLAAARELPRYARMQSWQRPDQAGGSLVAGARVVVVGAGDIGTHLVTLLAALGAHTVAITRSGRPVPGADESLAVDQLRAALPGADHVVVCAPSTPQTRPLLGAAEFAVMKPSAAVVNVSRGELIDTDALVAALRDGVIASACLDVVDPEPLPASSPLWALPNVLITPHVANPAALKHAALCERVRINTMRFAEGTELSGLVELGRGY